MSNETNPFGHLPGPRGSDARMRWLVEDTVSIDAEIARLQGRRAVNFAAVLDVAECRAEGLSARGRDHELAVREVSAELGAALRISDRVIQGQLSDAFTLVHTFPRTHAALSAGRISLAHARVIVDEGSPIEDAERKAEFEAGAVVVAEEESASRLRHRITMDAEAARTDTIDERHRAARAERCVDVRDDRDGMSELHAYLPTVLAHGIADRLNQCARSIKNHREADSGDEPRPDDRTLAQITADVFADLLLAAEPTTAGGSLKNVREHVQVNIPADVLTGASTTGAELVGHGPIDSDTARTLAAVAPGWDRLFTHPVTRTVLSVDRYQPSQGQRRILRVRDEHCRFPGCRYPAYRSDADHTIDAALGGPTAISNLGHFCRRHHTLKHHTRWRADNLPGGIIEWTSPLGVHYTDRPPRTVVFAGADDGAEDIPPF
ncbi:HNH endonuclease signature motif containing protein [Microbacterium gorillae]|uniref:HNH endonuclease signature motif containing protein n=1 Tax=Microbacterium gorillae TaxID=1231063 RepID=UPI000693D5A8|nr:HNH endonuclease signature motif containing protein [Microbacterium gorillae]